MHAEVMIGDCVVMLGEPMPGMDSMPVSLSYYVDGGEAVDATYARAIKAGASSVSEPEDQFYGYRSATVKDVGGNRWTICAVIEQLTQAQMHERMDKMMSGGRALGSFGSFGSFGCDPHALDQLFIGAHELVGIDADQLIEIMASRAAVAQKPNPSATWQMIKRSPKLPNTCLA